MWNNLSNDFVEHSFDEVGSSSCTPIAATMAYMFLKKLHVRSLNNLESLLAEATFSGIARYSSINIDPSIKAHMTVEEFLLQAQEVSKNLRKIDGPNQALLTDSNSFHDMLVEMVNNALTSVPSNSSVEYLSIIITKPPETVVVFVPIIRNLTDETNNQKYYFYDSHSRPELNIHGSYLVTAKSLDSIVRRLKRIFPPLISSNEDENYMTWMYNSFEGTSFVLACTDEDLSDYVVV